MNKNVGLIAAGVLGILGLVLSWDYFAYAAPMILAAVALGLHSTGNLEKLLARFQKPVGLVQEPRVQPVKTVAFQPRMDRFLAPDAREIYHQLAAKAEKHHIDTNQAVFFDLDNKPVTIRSILVEVAKVAKVSNISVDNIGIVRFVDSFWTDLEVHFAEGDVGLIKTAIATASLKALDEPTATKHMAE